MKRYWGSWGAGVTPAVAAHLGDTNMCRAFIKQIDNLSTL